MSPGLTQRNGIVTTGLVKPPTLGIVRQSDERSIYNLVILITALRWGTITAGAVWAAVLGMRGSALIAGVVLVAYAMYRTFCPLDYESHGWRGLVSILVELTFTVFAVVSTGYWDSPFIFSLFIPVVAAGIGRGFWHSLRIGVTEALAIGLAAVAVGIHRGPYPIVDWCGELLLTATVASYGRYLHTRAEQLGALNASQLIRLNDANKLLENLNRLANNLPASFDFTETVERAVAQAQAVAPSDVCAVLVLDEVNSIWTVALAEGAQLADSYTETSLPQFLQPVARNKQALFCKMLDSDQGGFSVRSRSAIYVPLWTASKQVGILALESSEPNRYSQVHVDLLSSIAEPMALTIDNARWFDRLRVSGATQERNRIARDIHDRLGQDMTYVALELDRLHTLAGESELATHIYKLKEDVRTLVTELREALQDIRTDVTEEHGLVTVVEAFLERVTRRSGLQVQLKVNVERRLALDLEREVWRIAQEAVVNAERHADATVVAVSWLVNDRSAELLVRDNGIGMERQAQTGSFGITGMRERARAIGAHLEFYSDPSNGTTVRLTLGALRETYIDERGAYA